MSNDRFIACGMYTPSAETKQAWQSLFDLFYPLAKLVSPHRQALVFDSDETLLRNPNLLIGHSCGYPLMTSLRDALLPFCTPCFDVAGSDGKLYSSQFVVPADSDIETLQQCRGMTVAINNANSNSGMNVLRYALAKIGARPGYFAHVEMTGGHHSSLKAVALNRAQLAAIDCVSYRLIIDHNPQLEAKLRVIGYSQPTCGLPFLMPTSRCTPQCSQRYLNALNQALDRLPQEEADRLHLDRFEGVCLDDYKSIIELESVAVDAGYAELN